tara:strand:+ start:173 stop:1111 length:939 start_codon:yes stop_codon:yes gene_type:complete
LGFKARPLDQNMPPKLVVAGVLALDDLKTPHHEEKKIVGGAGIYSSMSSNIFVETALVAAIGNDFPKEFLDLIKAKGIDTSSVSELDCPTFYWSGEYKGDMSQAITHTTDFQINEHYNWEINSKIKETKFLLLCNNNPQIQAKILEQMEPTTTGVDTMNLWINLERNMLDKVVSKANILFINDAEARLYSDSKELDKAAIVLMQKGPEYVIIKKGEKGASFYSKNSIKHLPAFKVKNFVDPTGAGDSFAGATMGYLSTVNEINEESIVTAMNYGAAVASITVQGFGTKEIVKLTKERVEQRFEKLNGGPGRI